MTQQNKNSGQSDKNTSIPPANDLLKQKQREKSETKEVAGRHKNDGQKDHKGRR